MKNNSLISIVTVTYNAEKKLEKTILSVLRQTYERIEYIIVDGNSTDKTVDIIRKYESGSQKSRIYKKGVSKWISEPDGGIYDAMNKALDLCTGDYVLFLGSDDILFEDITIENVCKYLHNDIVYYGSVVFDSGRVYWHHFSNWKFAIGNICHQCIFYPRSIYKNHRYNVLYRVYADYAYNIELWNNVSFSYIPIIITKFNENGYSARSRDERFKKDFKGLIMPKVGKKAYYWGRLYRILSKLKHFID